MYKGGMLPPTNSNGQIVLHEDVTGLEVPEQAELRQQRQGK